MNDEAACDVLLVEDDPDVREAIREFIEEHGFSVTCVADGAEALTHLGASPAPRVIILDVMMPKMDGREFRRRQMLDESLRAIPVVIATADLRIASPKMLVDEESGAWDLFGDLDRLAKPFEEDELLRVVRKYCATHGNADAKRVV